jgi:hypothetical protein
MSISILSEIERRITQLSTDEQLWLIEQLAHRLRKTTNGDHDLASNLAAMAADPEIQKELRKIDAEFRFTEADGLENSQ